MSLVELLIIVNEISYLLGFFKQLFHKLASYMCVAKQDISAHYSLCTLNCTIYIYVFTGAIPTIKCLNNAVNQEANSTLCIIISICYTLSLLFHLHETPIELTSSTCTDG